MGESGDRAFMREAFDQAIEGARDGGIPIGAVLVREGMVIGRGRNRRVQKGDMTAHAEIECLRDAGRGNYNGCTLYSTLMPCHLCAGAAVQFGIKRVVVGESRNFPGAREFMESRGIEVLDMDLPECRELLGNFIGMYPKVWNEDIGKE